MTGPRHPDLDRRRDEVVVEPVLTDWRALGARIRRASMVAASMHLVQAAGGPLDDGAAVETPRSIAVG